MCTCYIVDNEEVNGKYIPRILEIPFPFSFGISLFHGQDSVLDAGEGFQIPLLGSHDKSFKIVSSEEI